MVDLLMIVGVVLGMALLTVVTAVGLFLVFGGGTLRERWGTVLDMFGC